jgi:hypothetical protein
MVLTTYIDESVDNYVKNHNRSGASDESLLASFAALSEPGGQKCRSYDSVKEEILRRMRE